MAARWAEPGTDMGAGLTSAVVNLYDHTLRMSDKDRASITFPNESISGSPLSPAEQAFLLEQLLDRLNKIANSNLEGKQEPTKNKVPQKENEGKLNQNTTPDPNIR